MRSATITRLLVTKIDPYGYNGRDAHPKASDEGTVVNVERMEVEHYEVEGVDACYCVWYCTRADGTPVELIDHEVEVADE